jgi:hypothetical protein
MSMSVAPSGFETIEEWIVHQLYEQPKVNHMTHTLFQQLERVLQAEPSRRDIMNQLRAAMGQPPLSADHHIEEPKLVYSAIQYAVETLIQDGLAKGDRNSSVDGVYFTDLKLTTKGEAAAIRQKRKRAEGAEALAAASEGANPVEDSGTER